MKNYYIEYFNIYVGKRYFILEQVTEEQLQETIKSYNNTENIIQAVQAVQVMQ